MTSAARSVQWRVMHRRHRLLINSPPTFTLHSLMSHTSSS
jgi:hypothetical protein